VNAAADHSADVAVVQAEARSPSVAPGAPAGAAAASLGREPQGRGTGRLQQVAALHLQRSHGNAALSGWLARKPAPPKKPAPADVLTRGQGSAMIVGEDVSGDLYDAPDDTRTPIGRLKPDGEATLIGTAGDFYIVLVDGVKGYLKQSGVATMIDTPGADTKASWDRKLKAALATVDAATAKPGAPSTTSGGGIAAVSSGPNNAFSADFMALELRLSSLSTWNQEMEDAADLLRDYALWYFTSYHATNLPGNLKVYFDYIGRSSRNDAAAREKHFRGTRHLGGFVEGGQGSVDWCTQATTTAVKDALLEKSSKIDFAQITRMASTSGNALYAPAAYTAPLYPGDQVMYLFAGCQHGGHTVTVIDDLGDSFTHISGNATNAGVLIGEKRRLTKKPASLDLAKATPGPVYDKDKKFDKEATKAVFKEADEHLRTVDSALGDAALIYSIIRYGTVLNTLPSNPAPGASKP
jgi:hypothetical protein